MNNKLCVDGKGQMWSQDEELLGSSEGGQLWRYADISVSTCAQQALPSFSLLVPPPSQVLSSITQIASQLGLGQEAALHLVAKMPVLLALEPKLLALGINGEGGGGRAQGDGKRWGYTCMMCYIIPLPGGGGVGVGCMGVPATLLLSG